ncbi:MAG: hypothetical protein ABIN73_04360 [candidate division WOR-3 bacterium]
MIFLLFLINITYKTITVDGDLKDFSEDEKVLSDRYGDSFWGIQNELTNFFLTWDKNNIYIGVEYIVKNNALLIVFDTGEKGVSDLDILNWYPRNLKLYGIEANYILALWDADLSKGGFRKISTSGSTSDLSSYTEIYNRGKSGEKSYIEAKIPFPLIFENGFNSGSNLKIFLCIAGGDHSGSGDISPDNLDVDGLPPEYIRRFLLINLDKNLDAKPDSNIFPIQNSEIVESPFEKLELKEFKIDKNVIFINESVKLTFSLSENSNINISLITEDGKLFKKIFEGTLLKNEKREIDFNINKPGIYILLLEVKGKLRKKEVIKVVE